jgi:hypothetical protein
LSEKVFLIRKPHFCGLVVSHNALDWFAQNRVPYGVAEASQLRDAVDHGVGVATDTNVHCEKDKATIVSRET